MKMWKCSTCGAACEVDMLLGSPVLHKVPRGQMICRRSGERLFQPGILDVDGNLVLRGISETSKTRLREPLPPQHGSPHGTAARRQLSFSLPNARWASGFQTRRSASKKP